jgi:hypothetical protein
MNITYTPIGSGEYHLRVNGRTVAHAYQRGDAIVQTWAEANAQWDHSPGRQWKKWLAENGPVIQLPKVDYDHLEATGEVRYQSAAA